MFNSLPFIPFTSIFQTSIQTFVQPLPLVNKDILIYMDRSKKKTEIKVFVFN